MYATYRLCTVPIHQQVIPKQTRLGLQLSQHLATFCLRPSSRLTPALRLGRQFSWARHLPERDIGVVGTLEPEARPRHEEGPTRQTLLGNAYFVLMKEP